MIGYEMLERFWKMIMDPSTTAFMRLPKVVRFQLMVVLSLLWSTIFCVSAGLIVWLPGYILVHVVLIAIGIFGTRWSFKNAEKSA